NGIARDSDAEDAFKLLGTLKFRELTVSAFYATRDKTIPTASFVTRFNTGAQGTTDSRGYIDVKYEHEFSPEVTLLGRVSYDSYGYIGDYPMDYALPGDPPDPLLNKDFVFGEWL